MMKRILAAAFIILPPVLAAWVILAPGSGARAGERLRLGLLLPLSGDLSVYTPPVQNSILLASRLWQEAAGGGPELEMVCRDSRNDTAAADSARRLVQEDGVRAIIGPLTSEAAIAAATEAAVPGRVILISPAASSPDLSSLRDDDLVYRTVPSDIIQAEALANIVLNQNIRRVGVIYVNDLYGRGLSKSFRKAVEGLGREITAAVPYLKGQSSYRSELEKSLEGHPEALLVIAYPRDGIRILKQSADLDQPVRLLLSETLKDATIIGQVGAQTLNGARGTAHASPETPWKRRFEEAYREMFGDFPTAPYMENAFDAVILLALAAAREKESGAGLRESLRAVANPPGLQVDLTSLPVALERLKAGGDIDYQGVSGPLDFDDNGDLSAGTIGTWAVEGGVLKDLGTVLYGR